MASLTFPANIKLVKDRAIDSFFCDDRYEDEDW